MEELPKEGKPLTYKPLITKRIVIVSRPPEKITFDIVVYKQQDIKRVLFFNAGTSKATLTMEKDAF